VEGQTAVTIGGDKELGEPWAEQQLGAVSRKSADHAQVDEEGATANQGDFMVDMQLLHAQQERFGNGFLFVVHNGFGHLESCPLNHHAKAKQMRRNRTNRSASAVIRLAVVLPVVVLATRGHEQSFGAFPPRAKRHPI